MSGALLQVGLRNEGKTLADLGALITRVDNPLPMYQDIGQALITSTHHRWELGIAPDGSPWPPSLRVIAHGGKTLKLSTRLYRSITANASPSGVEVGTNVIYAAIHQLGGLIEQTARTAVLHFKTNKRTGVTRFAKANKKADWAMKAHIGAREISMPIRAFLGLDQDDPRTITTIVETWLSGGGKLA
jgi:phage virion morphogenesis protein